MNLRLPHSTNKHFTLWLLLLRVNGRLLYACAGANRILCTALVACCWLVSICRENYGAIAQTPKLMSAPLILVGGFGAEGHYYVAQVSSCFTPYFQQRTLQDQTVQIELLRDTPQRL